MKPSYEELQAHIDSLAVDRDHWRSHSLRIAAQADVLRKALAALSVQSESALQEDIFCYSALKVAQRNADEALEATPAACLAQVRADELSNAAESLKRFGVNFQTSCTEFKHGIQAAAAYLELRLTSVQQESRND